MVPIYFENKKVNFPPMYKKFHHENESTHRGRVAKYLLACDEQKFTELAHLIDTSDDA